MSSSVPTTPKAMPVDSRTRRHSAQSRSANTASRIAIERAHVGAAARRLGEARIGEEVLAADGLGEGLPAAPVGREREQEPAAVAAAIEVAERVDRLLARRPHHRARAAEDALHRDGVQPEPVGHQRRRHHRAAPRPLALVERGHDARRTAPCRWDGRPCRAASARAARPATAARGPSGRCAPTARCCRSRARLASSPVSP